MIQFDVRALVEGKGQHPLSVTESSPSPWAGSKLDFHSYVKGHETICGLSMRQMVSLQRAHMTEVKEIGQVMVLGKIE